MVISAIIPKIGLGLGFYILTTNPSVYRSKVDGRKTQLIPAAVELNGRWGDEMVSLFKKVVALATREGRNEGGSFATVWKRRLAIVARTTMIDQAHYALRKHFADDMDEL